MSAEAVTVMSALILCYALVARRLNLANITAPMLSVVAGVLIFSAAPIDIDAGFVHNIAEITLVIILFHDASTVKLASLRKDPGLAVRLLLIGFPLALVATFVVADSMLPVLGVAGAWLVAASITPTDAGLGAPTVLNPVVPMRVRRGLNVESGLNDGLATPIVLLALSALATQEGDTSPSIIGVGVVPVLLALACATAVGLVAAWSMDRSRERHLSTARGRSIATLLLPLLMFGIAEMVGANAFITAFVGGLVFGASSITLNDEHKTANLLETAADLLGFIVWFFAGGLLLLVFESGFRWQWLALAVLALTVLRMVPVFLSLLGTGLSWQTVAFIGWFGPRGLATIVFGLLAVEELGTDSPVVQTLAGVIAFTVLLSVFAHGITAGPLSRAYGSWAKRTKAPVLEDSSVEPLPPRGHAGY